MRLRGRITRRVKEGAWLLYSLAATLVSAAAVGRAAPAPAEGRAKVLVVKLDAIGDFVLWLDAAKELRSLFPEDRHEIVLLGNKAWVPLAEGLPYFDEVWPLDRRRFLFDPMYRIRLLRRVRSTGFRTVVHPTCSREFLQGDSVVRFSGARERIGSEGDCSNIRPYLKRVSDRWYTRLVPAAKEEMTEIERNAEFLRGLGLPEFRAGVPAWPRPPGPCPPLGKEAAAGYYVLFPGATVALKQWPPECFAEVARRLHAGKGWLGVICGSGEERELAERLRSLSGVPIQNLAGRTSLPELVSVVAGARLLVGNDTSGVHIAASVSVPSVCILGGGHYGRFLPYRAEPGAARFLPRVVSHRMSCYHCNWACVYGPPEGEPAPCVGNVSVDSVWDAVRTLL
jgi:ADP-heptose:LPS heptosyltransferase